MRVFFDVIVICNIKVYLLGNNLKCICGIFDFFKWLCDFKSIYFVGINNYICLFENVLVVLFNEIG